MVLVDSILAALAGFVFLKIQGRRRMDEKAEGEKERREKAMEDED
jgi:hypothetical protein